MSGALRGGLPVVLASLLVAGLLWLMMALIALGERSLDTEGGLKPATIILNRSVPERAVEARVRRKPPPPEPQTATVAAATARAADTQSAIAVRPDLLGILDGGDGPSIAGSFTGGRGPVGAIDLSVAPDQNRGMTPLVRVQPMFPMQARMRKVSGTVLVEFDVTAEGTVANARVVNADPPGFFERAALDAINKWRYRPRQVDGRAVPVSNLYVSFSFKLPDRNAQQETRR